MPATEPGTGTILLSDQLRTLVPGPPSPANRHLLVADDDAGVREAYQEVFKVQASSSPTELARLASAVLGVGAGAATQVREPFQLTIANQGQAAVRLFAERLAAGHPPAVAFIDMRMPPGWDGLTTIEELWKLDGRLQCVICTAYSDYSWEQITARLGVSDRLLILKKPFDRIEVLQMAESLCAKWQVARSAERHAAELGRQQNRLRGIIDNASAAISLKDLGGGYLLTNTVFCQRFRVDPEAVPGATDRELFPAAAAVLQGRDGLAISNGYVEGEEDDPRLDPTQRFLTVRFIIHDHLGGPTALCTIANDITGLKNLEAQVRQAQKMEALGRLAGGVAHDFNNLLSAIIGFSEMALHQVGEQGPGRKHLEQVVRVGMQAADLTRQLLAFSRRQVLKPQVVDVGKAMGELTAMLRRLVGETVQIKASTSGITTILIDRGQLQQILVNLVVNARDAMPGGGVITVDVTGDGQRVVLTVGDNGVGIAPGVIDRIWDPFFTTKEPGKGTGLGLATVHGIVHQSGGTIAVRSLLGHGTTFTLDFPRVEGSQVDESPSPVCGGGGERILVLEDRDDLRQLTTEFLRTAGYQVSEAADPVRAAEEAERAGVPWDLILSDVVMPGMSGPEVVARLRRTSPRLKVLYMTGYADRPDGIKDPVLAKPFIRAELLKALREALA